MHWSAAMIADLLVFREEANLNATHCTDGGKILTGDGLVVMI